MIIARWNMISLCSLLTLLNLKIIEFENLKMKNASSNFQVVFFFKLSNFQIFKLNSCLRKY